MSRSLALTQKRASIFNASQQITEALLESCGSAAGTWTKRNCSSTPFFVSCRVKHWCLGLELQKLCLNTTAEMLEPWGGGRHQGFEHTWGPYRGFLSPIPAGHGQIALLEGRWARAAEVPTGFVLYASRPKGLEEPSGNQKLHFVPRMA